MNITLKKKKIEINVVKLKYFILTFKYVLCFWIDIEKFNNIYFLSTKYKTIRIKRTKIDIFLDIYEKKRENETADRFFGYSYFYGTHSIKDFLFLIKNLYKISPRWFFSINCLNIIYFTKNKELINFLEKFFLYIYLSLCKIKLFKYLYLMDSFLLKNFI
jgi:hypothetical protein